MNSTIPQDGPAELASRYQILRLGQRWWGKHHVKQLLLCNSSEFEDLHDQHLFTSTPHPRRGPELQSPYCCCFLHINRSGLNHTQYYTWLPMRYVVCWTERDQRNIYQAPMRAKENTNKNDKEKGTRIAKYICQKKIDDGHSTERVWHSASREPSDTLPGSQPCTQTRSIHQSPYSQGFSSH